MLASNSTSVSSQMITEIAFGVEPPVDVAFRFGFDATQYRILEIQDWFIRAVKTKQADLKQSGWTFRAKMGMMAEDLLSEVFIGAKASDSLTTKLEVAKYLSKVADLEPKQNVALTPGVGFSITFNLNGPKQVSAAGPIDNVVSVQDTKLSNMLASLDELPPIPAYLSCIPFEPLETTMLNMPVTE